ncbi:MAG: DEAD/DEAH box helicase family protein, partial [Phycisphaerae bacterium]
MITLRPYQEDVKTAVYDHLRSRDDNPCAVVPTAGGKTPIMASICKDAVGMWGGRVLILAQVKELLEQTADKLTRGYSVMNKYEPERLQQPDVAEAAPPFEVVEVLA